MTPQKTILAFEKLRELIERCGYHRKFAKRLSNERQVELLMVEDTDRIEVMNHLLFMCDEGKNLTVEAIEEFDRRNDAYARSRYEKAMRWLGFVQGVLVAAGVVSIEQMKLTNGSDAETDVPPPVG